MCSKRCRFAMMDQPKNDFTSDKHTPSEQTRAAACNLNSDR